MDVLEYILRQKEVPSLPDSMKNVPGEFGTRKFVTTVAKVLLIDACVSRDALSREVSNKKQHNVVVVHLLHSPPSRKKK